MHALSGALARGLSSQCSCWVHRQGFTRFQRTHAQKSACSNNRLLVYSLRNSRACDTMAQLHTERGSTFSKSRPLATKHANSYDNSHWFLVYLQKISYSASTKQRGFLEPSTPWRNHLEVQGVSLEKEGRAPLSFFLALSLLIFVYYYNNYLYYLIIHSIIRCFS